MTGCSDQSAEVSFPESIELKSVPVTEISLFTVGDVGLVVADTFLVIQKGDENFVEIYSTNSHKLLAEFGREGNGPMEFIRPDLLRQVDHDPTNNSPVVHLFDSEKQIITSINILGLLDGTIPPVEKPVPIHNAFALVIFQNETMLWGVPHAGGRFRIYDYSASTDTIIPYVPELSRDISDRIKYVVYWSSALVNWENGLVASAPLLLGELNFFDLDGNLIRTTVLESREDFENDLKGGISSLNNLKYHIKELDAAQGLIYGLNFNNNHQHQQDGNQASLENSVKIQVFNWRGQAIKEYQLDNGRQITSFAVDTVHHRIYAYSPRDSAHTIVAYSLIL